MKSLAPCLFLFSTLGVITMAARAPPTLLSSPIAFALSRKSLGDKPTLTAPRRSASSPTTFLKSCKMRVQSSPRTESSISMSSSPNDGKEDDLFDYFDPRLSPHMYPGGIPSSKSDSGASALHASVNNSLHNSQNSGRRQEKIGILLIDHGSKRQSSNDHLESVAAAYQNSRRCPKHFVVRAAHMEIAKPSIEDGMRELIRASATRIVCLPYFLSPGKHATEDVPQLIAQATQSILVDHPHMDIVTTNPLGSKLHLMVDVMSQIVEESVASQFSSRTNDLGFFGDVMRMVEEAESQG